MARKLYAVGSNPDAAMMAGINSSRVVFTAFVLSGALAGLAGFIFLSKFGNITVVAGLGFELKSVAAVVVGGVNIFGGSGTILGVVLGTVLVDTIDNSLTRWDVVSEFWREALLGILIMIAVATDTLLTRQMVRMKAKKKTESSRGGKWREMTMPGPRVGKGTQCSSRRPVPAVSRWRSGEMNIVSPSRGKGGETQ